MGQAESTHVAELVPPAGMPSVLLPPISHPFDLSLASHNWRRFPGLYRKPSPLPAEALFRPTAAGVKYWPPGYFCRPLSPSQLASAAHFQKSAIMKSASRPCRCTDPRAGTGGYKSLHKVMWLWRKE